MASIIGGTCGTSERPVVSASAKSAWVTVNTDLTTADSATNLLQPNLVTRAAVLWVTVPSVATRILIRGRNLATMSAVGGTVNAVLRVYGVSSGNPNTALASKATTSPWSTTPGGTYGFESFMRLDNADAGATGITLPAFALTGNMEDGTYEYTDLYDLTGFDCKGCSHVGVLVETAISAVTGSANVDAQVKFLN